MGFSKPATAAAAAAPNNPPAAVTSLPVVTQLEEHLIPALDRIERLAAVVFERQSAAATSRKQPLLSHSSLLSRLSHVPPALCRAVCRDNSATTPYSVEQASGQRTRFTP